jgi:hypothetical protein
LESWSPWKTTLISHLDNQYFSRFFQAAMSSSEETILVFIEVKATLEENKIKTFLLLAENKFLTRNFQDVWLVNKRVNVNERALFSKGNTD